MTGRLGLRIGARGERRRDQAFTLIEVLVAAAVAAVMLAGAYGWLWNVAALAGQTDDRVQAGTLAAAAARAVGGDVRAAVGVRQPPAGRDPARSLSLAHDHVDVAPEDVLIAWDPARAVVWRNASGTYLADHITGFAVVYCLVDGSWLSGSEMSAPDWSSVWRLRVELAATVGSATVSRSFETNVGPA
jgi:prepilin-type N-terminal cleavage/methylation domain-containing protein